MPLIVTAWTQEGVDRTPTYRPVLRIKRTWPFLWTLAFRNPYLSNTVFTRWSLCNGITISWRNNIVTMATVQWPNGVLPLTCENFKCASLGCSKCSNVSTFLSYKKGIQPRSHVGYNLTELDALWYPKPMKAGQSISDLVGPTKIVDQPGRRVQHWLQSTLKVDRKTK